MPKALIAGIPIAYDKRVRAYLKANGEVYHPQWDTEVIRSRNSTTATINFRVLTRCLKDSADSSHVLSFKPRQDASRVPEALRPSFRFRWLDNQYLALAATSPDEFVTSIRGELEIETEWRDQLGPSDPRSAVLLPAGSFSAKRAVSDLWERVARAKDRGRIEAAQQSIERFWETHFRSARAGARKWIDTGRLVFDHDGERHGSAPFPRNWKFSYRLPDGFHYDVTHEDGRAFQLRDSSGAAHSAASGGHVNIDPHGYVI